MPAASEAAGAPGGGGGGDEEEEFEIRNDEGFVFKVPKGVSTAPSASASEPNASVLDRRRRALLRLRAKRLRDLSRWEALASEYLAPLPAPQPPAPPSESRAVDASASSSSASVLDELIEQVDTQTEFLKNLHRWCDEAKTFLDTEQAAIIDLMVAPAGNPADLVAALSDKSPGNLDEQNGRQEASGVSSVTANLDEQNGRQEASGVSSVAANMKQNSVKKQKSPIPTEKWKKEPGSTSTPSRTPGSTKKRKAESTPTRAPEAFCSSGPLTRRRAASNQGKAVRKTDNRLLFRMYH